jgi:hypothetical protein
MTKIMVRKHRGGYAESMETAKEIDATMEAVAKYFEYYPVEQLTVEPYGTGIDSRNGWNTHIVCANGAAIGMTNGMVDGITLTEKQQALDKKADNARKLGLDYEQEPYCWVSGGSAWYEESLIPRGKTVVAVYTSPPRKEWVGLTDGEINKLSHHESWLKDVIRAVEAKLKEKNHGSV